MKVLKHIFVLLLTLSMLFVSSGCNNSSGGETDVGSYSNSIVSIYDAYNQEIGSITCFGYSVLVDESVLYTKLPENASSEDTLEYWLYNIQTKSNNQLAVVKNCSFETSYEVIKSGEHLYLSIFSGSISNFEKGKQTIYDIDLSKYSMLPILEIEGGIPYNSYTVADNKLILAELLYNGYTDIIEYDLSEPHTSTVVHKYDETNYFIQNSIRHIYADDKNIYMLRLVWDEVDNYSLCLDTYDFDYNLLSTIDIGDFCVSTNIERTQDSKINEWKQFVAYFFVHNDLCYYQNFSTTNAIGIIDDDNIDRLFNTDALFSCVNSLSSSANDDLFIQAYGDDTQDRNIFYLVNSQTHEVKTAEFFAENRDYTFRAASQDGEKILLTMGYVPLDEGERLPDRLYFIDMNDLDFEPMD